MGLAQLVVIHTWSLIRSARTGYSLLDITLLVAPSHIDTVSLFCIKDVIRSPVFSGETFGCLWSGIELEQLLEYQSVLWMPLDWIFEIQVEISFIFAGPELYGPGAII